MQQKSKEEKEELIQLYKLLVPSVCEINRGQNHYTLTLKLLFTKNAVIGILNGMQKASAEIEEGAPYKVYNIGNNKS